MNSANQVNNQIDLAYITGRRYGRSPDILECLANLSSDEIFTPPKIVNDLLDLLPETIWTNPDLKWLDPGSKSGVFLREVAKRLLVGLQSAIPEEEARRCHIFRDMLFGIGITEITALVTRRSLYCSKDANTASAAISMPAANGNIWLDNTEHTYVGKRKKKCKYCGAPAPGSVEKDEDSEEIYEAVETHAYNFIHPNNLNLENMKFDVIIGNPPYQLKDGQGGNGSSAMPLYHMFVDMAKLLSPQYLSMIIPSRWFSGGKGLEGFRSAMLSDKRMKVLVDYPVASECFPDVEIKGGVCYFLWDKSYSGDCEVTTVLNANRITARRALNANSVFVRFNEAIPILKKVQAKSTEFQSKRVASRNIFGLISKAKLDTVKSETLLECFKQGGVGYVGIDRIRTDSKPLIQKWKVLVSKGYGAGEGYPHQIIGRPLIAKPGSVCTETYLVLDSFETEKQAQNFIAYVKTRFFRFLVSLHKNTQNTHKESYMFVPVLGMAEFWDDEKLYAHFGLSTKERGVIESLIKEMD